MKTVKKLSSIILSIIIAFSLPVCTNAAEGKFVSVSFETLNSDGEKEKTDEVLYTDGTYLYANPELFEEYTAYDYDEDNNAFVRAGQDFKLSLSSTTIDYKNKKATVKMMNSKHTFDLHNIFKFGNDYYLPLDQIAAYLKAKIKVDGTTVTIINSGYSVADAAYNFNEFKYILNYENIVDEIFGGSETAYRYYTVLYYFSSTIFGLKVSNLIGPVGDISNYKTALQKIVTDNTDYIKTQADPNSLTKRLNDASTFIKNGKEINDKLKDATTVMTTAYESFCDTDDIDNLDIDYIDAKNWGEVFGKLKTFYNYTDYAIKYISMTEDNKNMLIDAYGAEDKLSTYKLALGDTTLKFGDDAATSLCSKALDILVEDVPKTTVKTFAEKALPALALVKGTAAFFKLLGFDLTDNSSYSIMLDSNIAHNLTERYTNLAETAGKTKDDTEAFRKAGIFATLAMKNAYNSGNKLNKKVNGQSKYYNKKIEEVALRAQLFYRAAESKGYDDLNSISSLATKNQKNIADSKIISKAKKTDFEESSNNWRQAYMTFLREYMNNAETPENCGFSLVFVDNDNIPELVIRDGIAHFSGASVYTCVDSKVVKLIDDLGGTYGIIQYAERKGLIYSEICYQGHATTTIYKVKKSTCTKLISLYSNEGAASEEELLEYRINDKKVSESKYNTAWNKYENDNLLSSSDNDTELTADSIDSIADYKL